MAGIFVAGTDTGVGKTAVSVALIHYLRSLGWSVAAMKPVAAGCSRHGGALRNADALQLQRAASLPLSYREVNPYAFEPAVSPYLASLIAGRPVNNQFILDGFRALSEQADWVVIEGAGGWFCPLAERETMADLARQLELPVLLVVGLRLGCVSHAVLSEQAIRAGGMDFLGWVGNQPQAEFTLAEENLADLRHRLEAPCLGHFPFRAEAPEAATAGADKSSGFDGDTLLPILRRLIRSVTLPPFECADKPTNF
jgi:dethiobiotin synthetase